jgi:RNA polymerase sigma-70 factor (ECF subfamily)
MMKSTQVSSFPVTQWTLLVGGCRSGDPAAKRSALEELSRSYWYPLYAFARRLGNARHDAEDLTQGFFCYVLERDLLSSAQQERGKLRTFLLAVFQRYIEGVKDRDRALKRGGGVLTFSLDLDQGEERYLRDSAEPATPEAIFDRSWAYTILRATRETLRGREAAAARESQFAILEPFLSPDAVADGNYAEAALALRTNEEAARKMVSRLRKKFRDCLREQIAMTLSMPSDEQIDQELVALRTALRG